jgi:hypothetical protein
MKKKIIMLLISLSALSQGMAEVLAEPRGAVIAADSVPDKHTVRKMLHWVSIFTMFSNVDLSDKVDLKQYAEAADLAASFITNPELSMKIAEFRGATFVNVYPKGLVHSNEWVFKRLNDISHAQYSVMNAPYVNMEVVFTPINNNTAYMVTILFKGSPEVNAQDLSEANAAASGLLHSKQYRAPRESKDDVNKAIFAGLDKLQALFGSTYAPNIAVKYNDELYLNNHTLEAWQRTGEAITLSAVDRNGTLLSGVTWTNATASGEGTAQFSAATTGTTRVTVKRGNEQIVVNVRVKEFTVDWRDILRQVLTEVINQLLTEGEQAITESIERRQAARLQAIQDYQRLKSLLEQQYASSSLPAEASFTRGDRQQAPADELVIPPPDDERYRTSILSFANFRRLLVDEELKEIRKLALMLLLNPDNFNKLFALVEEDLAQVAAQLIIDLARGAGRDELKNFASQYINQKLDEVLIRQLGSEMGQLYAMMDRGATRAEIREWLSAKASEKIVNALN